MERSRESHKGENGKVAIIGGSATMHGAPVFSALAAEASGVDLLYVAVPACHAAVTRMQSLNFQVHPFAGNELEQTDIEPLLQMLATVDAAIIGPGLARTETTLRATRELIESCPCPLVLDASALQPWTLMAAKGKKAVVTPHLGELERMSIEPDDITYIAQESGITIHIKAPIDRVAAPNSELHTIKGGNPGLTVGGTGDALAGLIGGLIAQGHEPLDACIKASMSIKRAADALAEEFGFAYGTRRVIEMIPKMLHVL